MNSEDYTKNQKPSEENSSARKSFLPAGNDEKSVTDKKSNTAWWLLLIPIGLSALVFPIGTSVALKISNGQIYAIFGVIVGILIAISIVIGRNSKRTIEGKIGIGILAFIIGFILSFAAVFVSCLAIASTM